QPAAGARFRPAYRESAHQGMAGRLRTGRHRRCAARSKDSNHPVSGMDHASAGVFGHDFRRCGQYWRHLLRRTDYWHCQRVRCHVLAPHLQVGGYLRRDRARADCASSRLAWYQGGSKMTSYLIAIGIIALIYVLLALSLNLQWGNTGLINFGLVAFFAIGAYVSGLLTLNGWPIVLAMAAAVVISAIAAWPLGKLTLTLKEDYLAVIAVGFSEVVRSVLENESWLT